jgi:flagella basal body P-ring formation protein FlgA
MSNTQVQKNVRTPACHPGARRDLMEDGSIVFDSTSSRGEIPACAGMTGKLFYSSRALYRILLLALLLLPLRGEAAEVSRAQMEALLAEALATKLSADGVSVALDRTTVPLAGDGAAAVAALEVDPARQAFTATVRAGTAEQTVIGRYNRQVQALAPMRDLTPGEVIAEEDLDWYLVDEKALSARIATEPEQLVGMEVRRPLKAQKLVLNRDLRAPRLMRKGDQVVVRLNAPGLDLSMQGRAMNDAGMGETVRVLNLSSKKTIEGIVIGPQTVGIAAPMTTPATAAALDAQPVIR